MSKRVAKSPKPKPSKLNTCSFRIEKISGFSFVAGIDEVGRGCIAGPVVAGGVVFAQKFWECQDEEVLLITDSKLLKPSLRSRLAEYIHAQSLATEICVVSEAEIDRINILQATFAAARLVLKGLEAKLSRTIDLILFDGPYAIPQLPHKQHSIVGGDRVSKSIAAASIIAKVHRDKYMTEAAKKFPAYRFDQHKGYGTSDHWRILEQYGPCDLHRKTFLKKRSALRLGEVGENQVVEWLQQKDFRILHRNWRTAGAEIDIIAERFGELHFIEVRTRASEFDLEFSFPQTKQLQFRKAVQLFMLKQKPRLTQKFHLDFFSVSPEKIEPYWDVYRW